MLQMYIRTYEYSMQGDASSAAAAASAAKQAAAAAASAASGGSCVAEPPIAYEPKCSSGHMHLYCFLSVLRMHEFVSPA